MADQTKTTEDGTEWVRETDSLGVPIGDWRKKGTSGGAETTKATARRMGVDTTKPTKAYSDEDDDPKDPKPKPAKAGATLGESAAAGRAMAEWRKRRKGTQ